VTGLDWGIIVFALLMGAWGYQQGLIVGALSLIGFVGGALVGSRLGPALLLDGSESPYAPATALVGALLIGGIVAVSLEGLAHTLRGRVLNSPGVAIVDAGGGALLLAALGLGVVWLFGAVALNAPGAKDLRQAVQRSAILRALNDALPPSGFVINALNRIDPGVSVPGPDPGVGPPDTRLAGDPEVRAAEDGVVRVVGTACGLGVEGSGWLAAPGLVVTNAHVVAGQDDTTVSHDGAESGVDATPVHYDPSNDLALLRVDGLAGDPLPIRDSPQSGISGAVLGYPENGPFTITAARLGETELVISEDSYGRGPLQRELTALRGEVRSGNSGGPVVDGDGRVLTTVFASTTSGRAGGYGVPNDIVSSALADSSGEADTGACLH
jgi:S1-C subfamily serine protease